jgi:hypothetical protein
VGVGDIHQQANESLNILEFRMKKEHFRGTVGIPGTGPG